MFGIVCELLKLLCLSCCDVGFLVAKLSFHPPNPPYYAYRESSFHENDDDGDGIGENVNKNSPGVSTLPLKPPKDEADLKYELMLCEEVMPVLAFSGGRIVIDRAIDAKRSCDIPIIAFLVDGATQTILFSHGNATDVGGMYNRLCHMAQILRCNCVGYDYTGYGISNGEPSEKQVYKDIIVAVEWLIKKEIVKDTEKELILYGQSVGSGPSIYYASNAHNTSCLNMGIAKALGLRKQLPKIAGLVIHSGILSGLRVFTDSRLLGCFDPFQNIERIKHISCPLFVLHGMKDGEVPINHGRGIWDNCPIDLRHEPWWVKDRGHNDVLENNDEEYYFRLGNFMSTISTITGDIKLRGMRRLETGNWIPGSPIPGFSSPLPIKGQIELHTSALDLASPSDVRPLPLGVGSREDFDESSTTTTPTRANKQEGGGSDDDDTLFSPPINPSALSGTFTPTNYHPAAYLDKVGRGGVDGMVLGSIGISGPMSPSPVPQKKRQHPPNQEVEVEVEVGIEDKGEGEGEAEVENEMASNVAVKDTSLPLSTPSPPSYKTP
jgi:abhydrolase domain-containing protein 17